MRSARNLLKKPRLRCHLRIGKGITTKRVSSALASLGF
jgi:hypothetical protein